MDPRSGKLKQHYRHESVLQKAVKNAIRRSQITKNASCHTFRHSFATYLLKYENDIPPLPQESFRMGKTSP